MHAYLRSVGFSLYKKQKEIDSLLNGFVKEFLPYAKAVVNEYGELAAEIRVPVARNMGICILGIKNEDGSFTRKSYYPYLISEDVTSQLPVNIYRHVDDEIYSALIDDNRIGVTLIFRMDNQLDAIELMKVDPKSYMDTRQIARLAALSTEGKIILPVEKTTRPAKENFLDVCRVVDSVFMPNGVECDVYAIIGEIKDVVRTRNHLTGEELYDLTVEANDVPFHVGINANDLEGEPLPGRRFKGRIWMMGRIDFAFRD